MSSAVHTDGRDFWVMNSDESRPFDRAMRVWLRENLRLSTTMDNGYIIEVRLAEGDLGYPGPHNDGWVIL